MLAKALELHRSGSTKEAWDLYEKILRLDPTLPEAWHFLGLLNFQTGQREAGFSAIRHCLSLNPDYAAAHANLANMLVATDQIAEAEKHLHRALALQPDALPPRVALAMIQRLTGRAAEAVDLLRSAVDAHPKDVVIRHGFAKALLAAGRNEEAIEHGLHAVALETEMGEKAGQSSVLLGYALGRLGRFDEAAEHYRRRIERCPEDLEANHLLAACGGADKPNRADDGYVRSTFDKFASSFESQLARLGYRAPKLIQLAAEQCMSPAPGTLDVLDAGCGTGLLGALLKPWSSRLTGVDLSPGMLERARERGIYDSLVESELCTFIGQTPSRFQLVASADTMIYFGALEEFAQNSAAVLQDGGWLIFSLEDGADQKEDFRLNFHGRYAHRSDYVVRTLGKAGFGDIRVAKEALRKEGGTPVMGLILAAQKSQS